MSQGPTGAALSSFDQNARTKIAAAIQLALTRIEQNAGEAGWVSGSLPARLGNDRSDVDLFLVRNDDLPPVEQVLQGGIRIDVEYRTPAQLHALFKSLDSASSEQPIDGLGHVASLAVLDDAARLFYAVEVEIPGRSLKDGYASCMRSRETALRKSRILRSVSICSSKSEDIQGALEAGEHRQLLEISGRFLLEALEAYLVGCGEYYVGHKWWHAKLARTPHFTAIEEKLDAVLLNIGLPDSVRVAQERVWLGQLLIGAAMALGWDEPRAFNWAELLEAGAAKPAYVPPAQWVPARIGQSVVFEGLDASKHIRITPEGLLLWVLASSVTDDRIFAEFSRLQDSHKNISEDEVRTYLTSMVNSDLLCTA